LISVRNRAPFGRRGVSSAFEWLNLLRSGLDGIAFCVPVRVGMGGFHDPKMIEKKLTLPGWPSEPALKDCGFPGAVRLRLSVRHSTTIGTLCGAKPS